MRMQLSSILFTLILLKYPLAASQSSADEDNPQVQQLYNQAKQAQDQGNIVAAIARYQDMLRIAPKLGIAYNNLGALYFRERNYAEAASVLERGLKVNPGMPSAVALLGISLYETADYTRAKPLLEAALKANPKDGEAQMYQVKNLIKLGDSAGAAASLERMASQQPKNQEIFYLLARVYMQRSEQALAQMNSIDPNSVLSHQLSAEVMESMSNYDGAIVELKKAVDLAPQQAGSHYKLGNAYWNLSNWDQAAEQFAAELAIDPGNCMAQAKIGNIMLQKNADAGETLASVNKALTPCPKLPEARIDRARVLAKLNRNQEAVADLEAAEKATPNDASIHFLLARVYRSLGRAQDASQEMRLFSKLDEAARAATAERAQEVIKNKQTAH